MQGIMYMYVYMYKKKMLKIHNLLISTVFIFFKLLSDKIVITATLLKK